MINSFVLFTGYSKFYKSLYTSAHIQNTSGLKKKKSHNRKVVDFLAEHRVDLGGGREMVIVMREIRGVSKIGHRSG